MPGTPGPESLQRDQNLRVRSRREHNSSRGLGDLNKLTGIKKSCCRKHGEKTWKCRKCSKWYDVYSDCKAHAKACENREYRCDCGTLFSRRDSWITHRASCEPLAEEAARVSGITLREFYAKTCGTREYRCDCGTLFSRTDSWITHRAFCDALAEETVRGSGITRREFLKTYGTREYRCDCGTLFSRRDSWITHRAFCDAVAEETARVSNGTPGQALDGDHSPGAGSSAAGGMSVMGAPPSPRSANVGMRGGEMDLLSVFNAPPWPGMAGNLPGMGIGDDGLSMIPARWGQLGGPGTGPTTPGSGTRLSLGLMGESQFKLGGNSQMSTMEIQQAPRPSGGMMQTPPAQGRSVFVNMFSSGNGLLEMGGKMQIPSPAQGESIFANMFSSGNGLLGVQGAGKPPKVQQHESEVSNMMGGSGDFDISQVPRPSGAMMQIPSPAQGGSNIFSSGNGFLGSQGAGGPGQTGGNMGIVGGMSAAFADFGGGAPSVLNQRQQQQHTSTAQMSATAVLRRWPELGTSLSNTSLLRSFGTGEEPGGGQGSQGGEGNDNSSIALDVLWIG